MSFSFAMLCNDAALCKVAQSPFRSDLLQERGAPNGWGLAYYQAAQPLIRKQPKILDQPLDFCEVSSALRTNVIIAHVRGPSAAGRINENTQPFRFRSWTFCHIGTIPKFEQVSLGMRSSIPEFMRRNIRGTTDSEVLFFLFLAFLSDANQLDDPHATGRAVARALRSTLLYVQRLAQEHGAAVVPYCCIATNGRVLVAAQNETPLQVKRNSSYTNIGRGPNEKPLSYPHLKAVAVVAGREPVSDGWEAVTNDSALAIDADLNIDRFPPEG